MKRMNTYQHPEDYEDNAKTSLIRIQVSCIISLAYQQYAGSNNTVCSSAPANLYITTCLCATSIAPLCHNITLHVRRINTHIINASDYKFSCRRLPKESQTGRATYLN